MDPAFQGGEDLPGTRPGLSWDLPGFSAEEVRQPDPRLETSSVPDRFHGSLGELLSCWDLVGLRRLRAIELLSDGC